MCEVPTYRILVAIIAVKFHLDRCSRSGEHAGYQVSIGSSTGVKTGPLVPEWVRFISILANSGKAFLLRDDHGLADCTLPKRFPCALPSLSNEVRVAVKRHTARWKEVRGLFPTPECLQLPYHKLSFLLQPQIPSSPSSSLRGTRGSRKLA